MAIVGNLKELETTVFDEDFERRGAGINGIFDKFFEGMDGGDDDFAGRDLVYDVWRECLGRIRSRFATAREV